MIRYQLDCSNAHRFETWFRDSSAFDAQAADGRLACPVCGIGEVSKAIMAPAVLGGVQAEPANAVVPADGGALLDAGQRAVREALRALRTRILSEGHDVGSRFPEEARAMHDGLVPSRPIHGEATLDEARNLLEDGIMVLPLPSIPEELN